MDSSNITTKIATNKKSFVNVPSLKEVSEQEKSNLSVVSFTQKKSNPNIQEVSFNVTKENPKGIHLGLDNTYIPKLNEEEEFIIDANKLTYKQNQEKIYKKEEEYEKFKQKAIEKLQKLKIKKEYESEEEEESSSYSDSNEGDENSDENSSEEKNEEKDEAVSKDENRILLSIDREKEKEKEKEKEIQDSKTENASLNKSHEHHKHNKQDDFYHVDTSKITFFLYNYNTGYTQELKDPKYKLCQVDYQINKEKEKAGKINSKFINPKLAKERKKGASSSSKQIVDDDELDAYSKKKIKLKEIQKALASKEKQSSIVNLCIFSFIIFIFIIGSSVASLLINIFIRDKIIIYYNLIEKSVTLYRNLIFEINFVRELILLSNEIYTNIYDYDYENYFKNYSQTCYEYYLDTTFVLANLSTTINTLSEENKEKIIGKEGIIEIFDPLKKANDSTFVTKEYNLGIYSAFNELNAALYHVSQMDNKTINSYEDNVYYFMRNSMNYMMNNSEEQIDSFTNEFYNEINSIHYILIGCIIGIIIIYVALYLTFIYFYQQVEDRKQSYLSVFYEIGNGFIVSSLAKCERFSQKIQLQDDMKGITGGDKISFESSTEDSDNENDIGSVSSLGKIKESHSSKAGKARNIKKNSNLAMKIGGFLVIFILLVVQIISYYYYYTRINLYKHYVQYEYYNNKYNSRFLFPFIALREYLYDQKKIILMEEVETYLERSLDDFYTELATISDLRDEFTSYLPKSYSNFIDALFRDNQCGFIDNFLYNNHWNIPFNICDEYYYNTSNYGFQAVLTTYIEELRIMRDLERYYLAEAKKENFLYNESLKGTELEDIHYKNFINDTEKYDKYNKYNPALIVQQDTHKVAFITYRFVVMKVVQSALDNLFDAVHVAFDDTIKVGYIINIIFMVVVVIGFFAFWLPFVLGENETIYKTKNMLSIIPREVLFTLPHINIMLGIDEEGK